MEPGLQCKKRSPAGLSIAMLGFGRLSYSHRRLILCPFCASCAFCASGSTGVVGQFELVVRKARSSSSDIGREWNESAIRALPQTMPQYGHVYSSRSITGPVLPQLRQNALPQS